MALPHPNFAPHKPGVAVPMAKTLESPLDALALNYLSYGFFLAVNSVWAWIAVLTAALSFWRIRTSSSSQLPPRDASNDTASASSAPLEHCDNGEEAQLVASSAPAAAAPGGVVEEEGSRKTKFRLYYEEDDFSRENDDDDEAEDTGITAAEAANGKLWSFRDDWERMMAVRMGDLGWHRWVDMAALDGSVVRLWDQRLWQVKVI